MKPSQILLRIQFLISAIPVTWVLSFAALVIVASLKLGHIPEYGKDVEPFQLGLYILFYLEFILFLLMVPSALVTLILTCLLYLNAAYKKQAILFFLVYCFGIFVFFMIKYLLNSQFNWVFE